MRCYKETKNSGSHSLQEWRPISKRFVSTTEDVLALELERNEWMYSVRHRRRRSNDGGVTLQQLAPDNFQNIICCELPRNGVGGLPCYVVA